MKTNTSIIFASIVLLISITNPVFASEYGICDTICILDSSWDGTKYVSPGETYWLKAQIQSDEKLHVKIFYYDDSIVYEKTYIPDDDGIVLVEYTSPNNEDSLSFYRVAMMVVDNPAKVAGSVFRIGETYPPLLIRFLSVPSLYDVKPGNTIQLFTETNRWDNPVEPYSKIKLTLLDPNKAQVFQRQVIADELGNFEESLTITQKGFYKLIVEDQNKRNAYLFPTNRDTTKTITAEGQDFEIIFGHPTNDGIEFIIHDLIFDQQKKSLTVTVENPDEHNVRFGVKIPHRFLDGNMTMIVDGNLRTDIEQRHIEGYSLTFFSLLPGNHTAQIIGTSAIPEFDTIVMWVLFVSFISLILFFRLSVMLNNDVKTELFTDSKLRIRNEN